MDIDNKIKTNASIAWLGLILGVIALPIAVIAYNRSGENLDQSLKKAADNTAMSTTQEIKDNVKKAEMETKTNVESAAQLQSRVELDSKLMALRTRVMDNTKDVVAADEVKKLREDFRKSYGNAQDTFKTNLNDIDLALNELELDLRNGTANVIKNLERTLTLVRGQVKE